MKRAASEAWSGRVAAVFLLAAWSSLAGAQPADAAAYPNRPIKMLVGFSAGSGTDLIARVISKALSERLGQPIVVDNRAGAGGIIATDLVAKSPPDGYTLLTVSSSIAISPAIYAKLNFDTEADLTPVAYIGALPTVLLINTKNVPAKNFAEFVQYAKTQPGALSFGSSGVGGSTHLFAELFQHMEGVKMHHIPYKSGAQDTEALMSGEIDVLFETYILARPLLKAPNVLALAITGSARMPALPDVPTFAEAGLPAFDGEAYFGIAGPAKLPVAIVEKLNAALNESLKDPDVVARLWTTGGVRLTGGTQKEFAERIHADIARWTQVVKDAGIKPQ